MELWYYTYNCSHFYNSHLGEPRVPPIFSFTTQLAAHVPYTETDKSELSLNSPLQLTFTSLRRFSSSFTPFSSFVASQFCLEKAPNGFVAKVTMTM